LATLIEILCFIPCDVISLGLKILNGVEKTTDKASIDGVKGGKTPAAQQCGLENPSTKVPEGASCR